MACALACLLISGVPSRAARPNEHAQPPDSGDVVQAEPLRGGGAEDTGRLASLQRLAEPAPALGEAPTLDEYLRFGLANSSALHAARDRWRAASARVGQARGLPDPRLTLTEFIEDIQTRTGPQRRQLAFVQPLPGPGKRGLRGDIASEGAEAAWFRVEAARLRVVHEIELAFHDYAYLAQAVRIANENLDLLKLLEPVVQRRVQAGAAQHDLLRLLVEIGKLENDLRVLEGSRLALSARLDAALSVQGSELHPWPEPSDPQSIQLEREGLRARLKSQNPELESLRQEVALHVLRGRLAQTEGRPDFLVGVSYLETGEALVPSAPGSGDDPFALTFGVSLPIWRKKVRAGIEEAQLSGAAVQAALQDQENRLQAALEHAAYLFEDAARQVSLYQDSLMPRARQALVVTETAYRSNSATLLDTIDSQRVLLAFENALWRARRDQEQRRADIEALCGGTLP